MLIKEQNALREILVLLEEQVALRDFYTHKRKNSSQREQICSFINTRISERGILSFEKFYVEGKQVIFFKVVSFGKIIQIMSSDVGV